MKKQLLFSFVTCLLAGSAMAADRPIFYVGAYGGYGNIDGGYQQDGYFAQGRIAFGAQAFHFTKNRLGVELGVQSGNNMRLSASDTVISGSGGLPIQSTLKPFVDLLFTMTGKFYSDKPFSYFVKIGAAYRQMHLNDRSSSSDSLQQISPEVQLGLGYDVTPQLSMIAYYQGIYSASDANVQLINTDNISISNIPSQQAGFVGVEYRF
ncbi:MAG: hypothetical protein EBX40_01050 [Gammaproteobacteria bacterium]|nr:hypothetical protein [Gammaproteobacteria bacterium]